MAHPHDLLEAPLIGMCGYEFFYRGAACHAGSLHKIGGTLRISARLYAPNFKSASAPMVSQSFIAGLRNIGFLTVTICSFSGLEGRMRSTQCHSSFRSVYCRDRGMAVINNSITIKRERERGTAVGMGAQCRPQAWARQGGTCLLLETLCYRVKKTPSPKSV